MDRKTLLNLRKEKLAAADALVKSSGGNLTSADQRTVAGMLDEVDNMDRQLADMKSGDDLLARLKGNRHEEGISDDGPAGVAGGSARSDLRVKHSGAALRDVARTALRGTRVKADEVGNLHVGGQSPAPVSILGTHPSGVSGMPYQPTALLDAVPVQRVTGGQFFYLVQGLRELNADVVPTGGEKPTSNVGFERVEGVLDVVAHLSNPVDKYILQDVEMSGSFLASELQYGLLARVEQLIVDAIVGTSGVQVAEPAADIVATMRHALTLLQTDGYTPSAFVVSPADWERIELAAAAGSGEYRMRTTPVDAAEHKLYGVPVAVSTGLPAGKALALSEQSVGLATDGMVQTEWDQGGELFSHNQLRARTEGRFSPMVTRPSGIVLVSTDGDDGAESGD